MAVQPIRFKVEVKPKPIDAPVSTCPDRERQADVGALVLKSSGNTSLDEAAVGAAMRASFSPAKQRDKAVRVWVSIPFRFTLH